MKFGNLLFLMLVLIVVFHTACALGAEPAPYTEEAYNKISAAAKNFKPPPYSDSTYSAERAYKALEYMRTIYTSVGYSYDETVKKVAVDLRKQNPEIPPFVTVAGSIVASVHLMMGECGYQKVDCLSRYPADLADAIRSIYKTSKFEL